MGPNSGEGSVAFTSPKHGMNGRELRRRMSPRLHQNPNIAPPETILVPQLGSPAFPDLTAAPSKAVLHSKTPTPDNVSQHSDFQRRMSPRLHRDIKVASASSTHDGGHGSLSVSRETSFDVSVNSATEIEKRMSPKLHRDINTTPAGMTHDDGRGDSSVSRETSFDVSVNSATGIERRFSPRLHRDINTTPAGMPHDGRGGSSVSLGTSPDVCVNMATEIERRFSPRLHRDINIMPASLNHDGGNGRGNLSVSLGTSPNLCGNLAAEIERRLSPRLHPNIVSKYQEDASKESVFQRRLSPRFHPDQPKEMLNPPLKSCTAWKRLHDDFHPRSGTTAKRNKLHHPEAQMESTHLHSTGTVSVCNALPLHLSTCGLPMSNKIAPKNGTAIGTPHRNSHTRVKETLRIYATLYLQLLQEEEEWRKQQEFKKAKVETKKSKEKGNQSTMKNGNNGQNGLNSRSEDVKRGTRIKMRADYRADLKALSMMIKSKDTLNCEAIIGHVPGIDVGYQFYSRAEMVAVGLHNHWLHGIAYVGEYRSEKREFKQYTLPIVLSVVMSGQYGDDIDNSEDIIYTGQIGHDLVGIKLPYKDKRLIRGNMALKNSMNQSVPVRVIHGHDNPDSYSGKIYTYDGLYKVVETLLDKGGRRNLVYKLKRLPGQPKMSKEQVEFFRGFPPKTSSELPGLICCDITHGQEDIRIPVTNIYDDPPVGPAGFTYIKTIEVRESVELPPYATGCTCKGSCTNASTCACAKLNGSDFPYVRQHGGRLTEPKDIVFECGPNCGCGPECLNRTSQRGIKYHLEVYRTPDKGWAVRSRDFIPSGAPVCEYIGVLSRSDELDNVAENDYIFEIDCLHTMNEIEGRERRFGNLPVSATNVLPKIDKKTLDGTPEFSIDAGSRGNVSRFINHSCMPNLFVQCILSVHHDLRLARIVLFASDDIPPMQELTYDYGYALDSVVGPDGKIQSLPCFCGTAECRKRLY